MDTGEEEAGSVPREEGEVTAGGGERTRVLCFRNLPLFPSAFVLFTGTL